MRQPVKQIACINLAKTEFPYQISCISWHYPCVVIIGKYKTAVISEML